MNVYKRNTVVETLFPIVFRSHNRDWRVWWSSNTILFYQILSCVQFTLDILLVQCSNLLIDILNIVISHYLFNPLFLVDISIWTHVWRLWAAGHFWIVTSSWLLHNSWFGVNHSWLWRSYTRTYILQPFLRNGELRNLRDKSRRLR